MCGLTVPANSAITGAGTAMRDEHWKIPTKGDVVELYDLSKDIRETTNVADEYPQRTEEMKAAIEKWKFEVAPQTASQRQGTQDAGGRHD